MVFIPPTKMTGCLWNVVLLLFVSFASNASGSTIVFQSSSSTIKPLLTSNFTLRCSLRDTSSAGSIVGRSLDGGDDMTTADQAETPKEPEDTDDTSDVTPDDKTVSKRSLTQTTENMPFVTSVVISRDGVDLATLTEHFPASSVGGASGFQVSGQITATSGERGFLELVWPHPTQADCGNYRCDVDTLNSKAHSYDFSQTLEITAADVSINDLVSHVNKLTLEKEQIINTIEALKTENAALKQSIESLKSIARTEPNIFFTVVLTKTQSFSNHQTLIFDKIYSNEGASYDNHTGNFICPVAGFYRFDIHTVSYYDQDARFMLQHNGKEIIDVYCDGARGDKYDGGSNSAMIKLVKGDTVSVVSSGNTKVFNSVPDYLLNTFSGKLISLA